MAVQPTAGTDFDLRLLDGSGALLTGSYWGAGVTDLVAINSTGGARPRGSYQAQVTHYSGGGQYSAMFWEKRVVFPVPTDPVGGTSSALALRYGTPVAAYMIYLRQGQGFRVNTSSDTAVYLAGSTPGVPSTYLRTRSDLANADVIADNIPSPNGAHCRVFQASSAGRYSLIVSWNVPALPPPYPNRGLAVFPRATTRAWVTPCLTARHRWSGGQPPWGPAARTAGLFAPPACSHRRPVRTAGLFAPPACSDGRPRRPQGRRGTGEGARIPNQWSHWRTTDGLAGLP